MKKGLFAFLLTFMLGIFTVSAQVENPAQWSYSQKSLGNNEYELVFKAALEPGWHIYSMYTPEGGPMATTVTFEEAGKGIELVGKATENEPKKEHDDVFGVDVWSFELEYVITQKIKVTDPAIAAVKGEIEFQVCREGQCVRFDESFDIKIGDQPAAKTEVKAAAATDSSSDSTKDESLWIFFWGAFVAGLAAVVMPCVFPMIPMTVSFFMHGDTNKAKAKAKAIFFSLSIIAIYTALGLIISMLLGPDFINWLSTNWVPNVFFFVIFMIFAASFFGAFEIVLPSWIVNKSDAQADKGGYVGAFFMAFTLVLVSFSCTGPIIGTLLVQAASMGTAVGPAIGMFGFALALSIPFSVFAIFPNMLQSMPKSGGWLNSVKVVLGFLELALALKFLSVADLAYGWRLLDREAFIVLWIVIFSLLGVYLLGKIKFSHDSEVKYVSVPRLFMAIISFAFAIYMVPGLWGAPLKAISAFAPPLYTQDFNLYKNEVHAAFDDYESGMAYAKKVNKPVMIDFSGFGCVNCRKMEASVWTDPKVKQMLENDYVLITLMVDDKTKLPQPIEIQENGKTRKLKTIGDKWSYLQRSKFGSNAQPFYILLNDEGQPLGPSYAFNEDVSKYIQFLQNGLKEFKKEQQ